jgi:hypothetical protein
MKRMISSVVGACLLLSGGAAHAAEKVMYQEITDNKPEVGVSTTVYLGDRMLEQRRGQWQECIVPKFDSRTSGWNAILVVKAGEPLCKSSQSAKNYDAITYSNGIQINWPVVYKPKSDGTFKLCGNSGLTCTASMQADKIDVSPYFAYSPNAFQQTIEYAGRSGDILKFTYSEFADGFARQAFTREFQVDLSQGSVAAYKGAVIEIESATNSQITYKVVRNFQQ